MNIKQDERIKIVKSQIEHCDFMIETFTHQKEIRLKLLESFQNPQKGVS